jgi:hypothetical protein
MSSAIPRRNEAGKGAWHEGERVLPFSLWWDEVYWRSWSGHVAESFLSLRKNSVWSLSCSTMPRITAFSLVGLARLAPATQELPHDMPAL